jgi:hypothetical protein
MLLKVRWKAQQNKLYDHNSFALDGRSLRVTFAACAAVLVHVLIPIACVDDWAQDFFELEVK